MFVTAAYKNQVDFCKQATKTESVFSKQQHKSSWFQRKINPSKYIIILKTPYITASMFLSHICVIVYLPCTKSLQLGNVYSKCLYCILQESSKPHYIADFKVIGLLKKVHCMFLIYIKTIATRCTALICAPTLKLEEIYFHVGNYQQ